MTPVRLIRGPACTLLVRRDTGTTIHVEYGPGNHRHARSWAKHHCYRLARS